MIGLKIQKPLQDDVLVTCKDGHETRKVNTAPNTLSKYSETAKWCNENDALIEDRGDYYEVVAKPELSAEELATNIRMLRDAKLSATDYLVVPDYPISSEELQVVKEYRQALRDIPQQAGFPKAVEWPEEPTVLKK